MIQSVYYWVVARLPTGRMALYGPAEDYQEASSLAYQKCPDCEWEIITMPTRDPRRAGQILRARRLQHDGVYISDVMRPIKRT